MVSEHHCPYHEPYVAATCPARAEAGAPAGSQLSPESSDRQGQRVGFGRFGNVSSRVRRAGWGAALGKKGVGAGASSILGCQSREVARRRSRDIVIPLYSTLSVGWKEK